VPLHLNPTLKESLNVHSLVIMEPLVKNKKEPAWLCWVAQVALCRFVTRHSFLRGVDGPLPTARCPLPVARCCLLPVVACCPLPVVAHCPLPVPVAALPPLLPCPVPCPVPPPVIL
jgi:hypothetical protein